MRDKIINEVCGISYESAKYRVSVEIDAEMLH